VGFNADAFLAARERWTLTLNGRTYTARPVSVQEVMQFQRQMDAAGADLKKQRQALQTMLRLMFPARWAYVFGPDPVQLVLRLDSGTQGEVLRDFFEFLARSLTGTTTTRATPPSTPLSAPTPPPPTVAVAPV